MRRPCGDVAPQTNRKFQRRWLERAIDKVFEVDDGIRFVAVYQEQYMLAGGMRKGTASYDPEDEAHEIDMQLSRIGEIARSWQRWFGTLRALILSYERLNLVFQPLGEGRFLVLSTEPSTDPVSLMEKLRSHQDLSSLVQKIP